MHWLAAIIKGLFSAILSWWQRQADKPDTIQDANTPDDIARRNAAAYKQWLRDQNKGDGN